MFVFIFFRSAAASFSVASLSTYGLFSLMYLFVYLSHCIERLLSPWDKVTWSPMPFFQLSPLFYCSPYIWGDTFGFASLCVSECLFGRFIHCSAEVLNDPGSFILEGSDSVPERDAELIHNECVLQLWNVWSLISCHSNLRILLLQGHLCHKQVMVTTDVCISHYPHILKRASPFTIDDDMINLTLGSSVRWCPGTFAMSLCVKRVPPKMRLFSSQRLMTLSPLHVRSHIPCFDMTLSLFLLLHLPIVLRSPSKSKTYCRGTSLAVICSE